jgi:hypothetical protein
MSESLQLDPRTIRRGKAALRAAGLLTWEQRGHHRTPIYRLLWDRLVQLAAVIKTRVKMACRAARTAISATKQPVSTSPEKPAGEGPASRLGRTFSPAYPTHQSFKGALEKRRSAQAAPLRTQITDAELDARASARFWNALKSLGPAVMSQFIAHPSAEDLQAQAIRAERFKPDDGRTGIAALNRLLLDSTA